MRQPVATPRPKAHPHRKAKSARADRPAPRRRVVDGKPALRQIANVTQAASVARGSSLPGAQFAVLACLALSLLLIATGSLSRACARRWGNAVIVAVDERRTDLVLYGIVGVLAVAVGYLVTGA